MNIVVLTFSGKVVVRPDTTWEKDGEDFFVPDFVSRLSWTPVVYSRLTKPGRSIAARFAGRYFESLGFGTLLYPEDFIDGSPEGFARACCLDHTSFLPGTMFSKSGCEDVRFSTSRDGQEIFACGCPATDDIEAAIAETSRFCYLRTGDLVAVELQARSLLCRREDGQCRICGKVEETGTQDGTFNIIF